jgi:hypothetical protein
MRKNGEVLRTTVHSRLGLRSHKNLPPPQKKKKKMYLRKGKKLSEETGLTVICRRSEKWHEKWSGGEI